MRTPETLTAAKRAASLRQQASGEAEASPAAPKQHQSSTSTPHSGMTSANTQLSAQQKRIDQARNALKSPSSNATQDVDPMDEVDGSITLLSINDIVTYSHNPRSKPNPKRAEIKASLQAEGKITNTITVTRRSPKEKYFPYGGGNTRVELAKELFAEGDQRFATLHVITKKWPGEAKVITAHLSENDIRGDISFWERAQGVIDFKKEFEIENGVILSTTELNKVLKNSGLNYGVKMVQNFIFAHESLQLIGPWLRTEELNTVIRPFVSAVIELAGKFDSKDAVQNSLDEIMLMHGQDLEALELANKEKDPAQRQEPKLDVQSLITDFQSVAAKALKLQVDDMPAVLQAVTQDPSISVEEIKKIKSKINDSGNSNKGKQSPLGGMLGGVDKTFTNPESNKGKKTAVTDSALLEKKLIAAFTELNTAVPIADFLATDPRLPFGFYVDFPVSMEQINGQPVSEEMAGLRESLWPILASLSGQANEAFAGSIPADSAWAMRKSEGESAMAASCVAASVALRSGVLYITSAHFWMLMAHPKVGPAFMGLLKTLSEFHVAFPQKFQIPFKPLFS